MTQEFSEFALAYLRSRGVRMTRGRVLIVGALSALEAPASAYAICDALRAKGEEVDVTTVYRTLEMLEENGLVHQVGVMGGYLPCRLVGREGWHVHLICRSCGRVEEVEVDAMAGVSE